MNKNIIKLTENQLHKVIRETVLSIINEEGEGGMGGAASCGNVMQGGGSNPSAGQYDVPFGDTQRRDIYAPARKRSKDFKNGSMMMQRKK